MSDAGKELTRLPQVQQKLRESGYPGDECEKAPRSGQVPSVAELAATLAHDVNNPLAVVVANLDFLSELISQMSVESGAYLETPEARDWLTSHLVETEVCLKDVREAAQRIRGVVRRLQPQHVRLEALPAGVQPDADPTTATKRNVLRHARVLVVDDQESVAKVIQRCLRDYDVVALVSAHEALARITGGERFDVILCDMMMPEMPGSDLYAAINRLAPEQAQRMIFVTGGATTARASEFLATVAQPVLEKPFDPKRLRALLQDFVK